MNSCFFSSLNCTIKESQKCLNIQIIKIFLLDVSSKINIDLKSNIN